MNIIEQFEMMDDMMLSRVEGGACTWSGLGKAAIGTGAGNGFRLGIRTRTWQGVVAGTAGGALIGGVGYGATCWWWFMDFKSFFIGLIIGFLLPLLDKFLIKKVKKGQ